MTTLQFKIRIDAPKEKVWHALWDDRNYRTWTGVFCEGSYVVSEWKEGGEILFLNGLGGGMYSVITRNTPYEFMWFSHLGDIKDSQRIAWKDFPPTKEEYTLSPTPTGMKLMVEIEVEEEFKNYFDELFPKALEKVKELAEMSI